MYGLPDSAVLGTAKRVMRVGRGSRNRSKKVDKPVSEVRFFEVLIMVVMPMIWLAEYYNKKRAESDTPKK